MCGFTGWYKKNHKKKDKKVIKKMTNTLKYRGPDQKGYFIDKNILLGTVLIITSLEPILLTKSERQSE